MKHRLVPDRGSRTQGEVATAYSTTRNAPDKTRYAGSTAFDGHRLQFRKNESERIVEHARTGFAHNSCLAAAIHRTVATFDRNERTLGIYYSGVIRFP